MILIDENEKQEDYSADTIDQMEHWFSKCAWSKVQNDELELRSLHYVIQLITLQRYDEETRCNRNNEQSEKPNRNPKT